VSSDCVDLLCNNLDSMIIVSHVRRDGLSGLLMTAGTGASFDPRSHILTVGPVKMHVKQGDITKEKVDAIINSTNERIDMTSGR